MAAAMHGTKHQKQQPQAEKNQEKDPSKFYNHFLYKAAIVTIFFVILPLFPSQAPEFINQSLVTRNWELLHILFVGIAISYGLFSRRNDETDKENGTKFENAQTLVSRFLQVSSFFEDDEAETTPSESDHETKVQTWSHQQYRNEPVVVVAPQAKDEGSRRIIGEKPLLLPVRSLKSRLSDVDDDSDVVVQSVNESISNNRSNSKKNGSKRFSSNRNAEVEGPGSPRVVMEDKNEKDNFVLPSPIPWRRSRSGRMEPKQEILDGKTSMEESEFKKMETCSVKSSSRTNSMSSSPKLTPSPSLSSSESLAKNGEDVMMRKKGFYKSCPPPPPPPPPMFQKSISMRPRYGGSTSFNEEASFDKELKRSFTSERNGRVDVKQRSYIDNKSMGKSFRSVRGGQNHHASFSRGRGEEGMNGVLEESQSEDEEHFMEELSTRKNMKNEHRVSFKSDPPMEFEDEEKEGSFLDKVIMESDDDEDTETEDEDVVGRFMQKESGECPKTDEGPSGGDEGPDVDKKADEFIAKFREQIRLQRIESIKRSTRTNRNSSR